MNKIQTTYLIGSIQDLVDPNASRENVDKKLTEAGFNVLNPCKLECNISLAPTIEDQKKKLYNLKLSGHWKEFDAVMDEIINTDLRCVIQADFLVVFWDTSKRHGGTIEEILVGISQSKPIYVISSNPISEFNDWLLRRLRKANAKFFKTDKQFLDFVLENA